MILPCYNAASTLPYCLESLVAQTTQDFEVVAVNDGSTDETLEVLEQYERKLTLKIINQENKGLGGARNAAIKIAEGDYIALLDADDFWHPNKLEHSLNYLNDFCLDLVCHDEIVGRFENGAFKSECVARHGNHLTYADLLIKGNCLSPSAVVMKASLFSDVGLFSEDPLGKGVEDWALWLSIFRFGASVGYLKERLGYYVQHQSNMSDQSGFYEKTLYVFDKFAIIADNKNIGFRTKLAAARQVLLLKVLWSNGLKGSKAFKSLIQFFISIQNFNPYFWILLLNVAFRRFRT